VPRGPSPAPATSKGANGFPVRRSHWFVHQRTATPRPRVRGCRSRTVHSNERWATDVTHVPCGVDGWAHLAAVIDCHDREVILPHQGCARREAGRAAASRRGCPNPRSRRAASSLRPAGGIGIGPGRPGAHALASASPFLRPQTISRRGLPTLRVSAPNLATGQSRATLSP
jgi:hypothetical protein